MFRPSFVIGIAGASCSGKSSVAGALADRFVDRAARVFELDWYYRDHSGVSEGHINVDIPGALDDALIVEQLTRLVSGHAVDRPVYDYATHARTGATARVEPAEVIIVEGLFTLHWDTVRDMLDVSAFILSNHGTCLARRIARDTEERGRTIEEVMRQYHRVVRPMYEEYVHPTRHLADLLLQGAESVEDMAGRIHTFALARMKPER